MSTRKQDSNEGIVKALVAAARPAIGSAIQDEQASAMAMQAAGYFAIAAAIDRLTQFVITVVTEELEKDAAREKDRAERAALADAEAKVAT